MISIKSLINEKYFKRFWNCTTNQRFHMEGLNSLLYAACNFIFYTLLLVGYSKSTEKHGGKLTNKFRLLIKKKSIIFHPWWRWNSKNNHEPDERKQWKEDGYQEHGQVFNSPSLSWNKLLIIKPKSWELVLLFLIFDTLINKLS